MKNKHFTAIKDNNKTPTQYSGILHTKIRKYYYRYCNYIKQMKNPEL